MTIMILINVFLFLTGIYEPSAVQQLPDGSVGATSLSPGWAEAGDDFRKLDDLEGLAIDRSGFIYALTSHSRDGDGDEKKSRDKLVRFRLADDHVDAPRAVKGMKLALVAAHPVLAHASCLSRRCVLSALPNTSSEDLVFLAICTPRFSHDGYEDLEPPPCLKTFRGSGS